MSGMQYQNARTYTYPASWVYAALKEVLKAYTVATGDVDDAARYLSFSTGVSALTWGQRFTAQVAPTSEGGELTVQGVGKWGPTVQNQSKMNQIIGRIFSEVLRCMQAWERDAPDRLASARAAQATAVATPVASEPDIPGQIVKLADLRAAGILTEEEFAAKKAELLKRM